MKNNIWVLLTAISLVVACNNPENKESHKVSTSTEQATAEVNKGEESPSKTEEKPERKTENVADKVAPLLQQEPFFKVLKNAQSNAQAMLSSSYEYVENNGSKQLDGKALVKMEGMGFGSSTCAHFKNGKLQGLAYEAVSTPSTHMLSMQYDQGALKEAYIYIMDIDDCQAYGPIKGKNLDQLRAEFNEILAKPNDYKEQFKAVDCPKAMKELFN